jgi:glycosyltransferase involved in cell wall biosynthesis
MPPHTQHTETDFRPCAVIPTYDNPATIERVVEDVQAHVPDVIVVDDGSGPEAQRALERLEALPSVRVVHRAENGGKGAAVKTGLRTAHDAGFTHAMQVDADGQHDLNDVPKLLQHAHERPNALILAEPVFDEGAPKARLWGRKLTVFWTHLETGGKRIGDPLCGFRVYPVEPALRTGTRGDRMDFDPEIAVRLVRRGLPVVNVPTRVRYVSREQGGVSHFRMVRDNMAIGWMHTRLCVAGIFGWIFGPVLRFGRTLVKRLPG